MILEYHRPTTLSDALALLARVEPLTAPLGGGTVLNQPGEEPLAVVDLQALGLDTLQTRGSLLELGAALTLQTLLEADNLPQALRAALAQVIEHEASYNLRQAATTAGTLVACDGRSPFATALLALDASLRIEPGGEAVDLGDLLPVRGERLRGRLITHISLPSNARLAYHAIARTPADRPIVCAAAARWPSGRVRLALGGYGGAPTLAFDGSEADGLSEAAGSAYSSAGDQWASAEYRREMAGLLAKRCAEDLLALSGAG